MSEPIWVPLGVSAAQDVGAEVAYAEYVATVSITGHNSGASQLVVTSPSFMADGNSSYLVEFYSPYVYTNTAGGETVIELWQDGVCIAQIGVYDNSAVNAGIPFRAARRITPAAGARTYTIRAWVNGTAVGGVGAGAGGAGITPGFIRITKVPTAVASLAGMVPPTVLVTSLPASPVDGQECILTDSLTAPTYTWNLRYVAAKASNKWVFVGGVPALSQVPAFEATAINASFVSLTTVGPSVALPVAGDYIIALGFNGQPGGATYGCRMSFDIGATAALDADSCKQDVTAAGVYGWSVARTLRKNGLGAVTLLAKYRATTGGTSTFGDRWMEVTPVAIGG